jgi:protease PrsW
VTVKVGVELRLTTLAAQTNYPLDLEIVLLSMLATLVPTLFFVMLIYWVDRYEKEPFALLAAAFVWGAVPSVVAAIILNLMVSLPSYLLLGESGGEFVSAVLIAPVLEESLKGLALVGILLLWRHEFDSPLDGVIYGATVGLGFAMVENLLYFLSVYGEFGRAAWQANIVLRAVVFGLNHALYSSLTGLGISVSHLARRRTVRYVGPPLGWLGAVLLHFAHNLSATLGGFFMVVTLLNAWGGLAMIGLIVIWAVLHERALIHRYLAEEVDLGTISPEQFHIAHSPIGRSIYKYRALVTGGRGRYLETRRFYQQCCELAFAKRDAQMAYEHYNERVTASLRAELGNLSKSM